jgi:hypothetical protein
MIAIAVLTAAALLQSDPLQICPGNGEHNWIITEDATRDGAVFTFSEVKIDGPGWLVMHPFADGQPVRDVYVGHTYLSAGLHENVEIEVDEAPDTGTYFTVMLHSDVDDDQHFDFVFVEDGINVEDRAVFEGNIIIAHRIAAP